ncbi:hypothetical protein DRO31_07740 [Candidatus Bathyarchaeota archaeon]|nr:MAG: hypothetical protein DRO31_07740 [Candidatus Bathyarchaeota archaeon]
MMKASRVVLCYFIFVLLAITWIVATITGFTHFTDQLLHGGRAVGKNLVLGIPRGWWVNIHSYSSIAFTIICIAHIIIN